MENMDELLDKYVHNVEGKANFGLKKVAEFVLKNQAKFLQCFSEIIVPDKPTWPYIDPKEGFVQRKHRHDHDTEASNQVTKGKKATHLEAKRDVLMKVSENSVLRSFIDTNLPNIDSIGEFGTNVQNNVRNMLQNSLEELKGKFLFFKDSFVIDAGSMTENTRILKPDELDFLIALPILSEEEYCSLYFVDGKLSMWLQENLDKEIDKWFEKHPVDGHPALLPDYEHPSYFLRGNLEMALKKNLPIGTEMLDNEKHKSSKRLERSIGRPSTFHFSHKVKGYETLLLSVDVSFCIPLQPKRLETLGVCSSDDAPRLKLIHERCIKLNTFVCAVVNMSGFMVQADRFHFEADVRRFAEHNRARECYMLAKYVSKLFLPLKLEDDCLICSHSIIPSYALKTIIFYMMEYNLDPALWEKDAFENRLIEVFEILLHSDFALRDNVCFLWKVISIDETQKLNTTGIKIPDKNEAIRTLDNNATNERVSEYWDYMTSRTCTLAGLMENLISLLKYLRDGGNNFPVLYKRT